MSEGTGLLLADIVAASRAVAATRSRKAKVAALADALASAAPEEIKTVASYLALARATLDRVVTDGRLLPIRAAKMRQILDAADPSMAERVASRRSRTRSAWA